MTTDSGDKKCEATTTPPASATITIPPAAPLRWRRFVFEELVHGGGPLSAYWFCRAHHGRTYNLLTALLDVHPKELDAELRIFLDKGGDRDADPRHHPFFDSTAWPDLTAGPSVDDVKLKWPTTVTTIQDLAAFITAFEFSPFKDLVMP